MKVVVVGAGYAGLAVTWFLLQKGAEVTVFDGGEGASHASTGLLHPAPGKKATPTWRATEGMAAALQLLEVASAERPVYLKNGILRIAQNEEQRKEFGGDTLFVPEGITVFSRLYLQGIKKACARAKFINGRVGNLAQLAEFDRIVLTTGAETSQLIDLPLKKTIGQCLICRSREPIQMSLLSNGHITPTEDPEFCLVGSTYEHTDQPDRKKALDLIEQVAQFYPSARDFEVVEIRSGVRASPKVGYRPIVLQVNPKTWVFTGLGSRGLIYHALLGKELVCEL